MKRFLIATTILGATVFAIKKIRQKNITGYWTTGPQLNFNAEQILKEIEQAAYKRSVAK